MITTKENSILKKTINFYVIAFTSLFIGIRNGIGSDWEVYKEAYEFSIVNGNYLNFESLYFFSNILFKYVGLEYNFYLVALALLFNFSLLFSKVSNKYFFIFYFIIFFSVTIDNIGLNRQILSISFMLLAHTAYINKRKYSFIILSLIACLFHFSAVIALAGYYLIQIKSKKIIYLLLTIAATSIYIMPFFITSVSSELETISKLQQYSVDSYGFLQENTTLVIAKRFILILIISSPFLLKDKRLDWEYYVCMKLCIFGFIIFLLFMNTIPIIATRGTIFYNILGIICLIKYSSYSRLYLSISGCYLAYSLFSSSKTLLMYMDNL